MLMLLLSEHLLPRAWEGGFAREAQPRLRGGAPSLWRKHLPFGLPLWRAHPCQSGKVFQSALDNQALPCFPVVGSELRQSSA